MWINREMPRELLTAHPSEDSSRSRGEKISMWMQGRDNRYVIIDDEYDFDISQRDSIIMTNNVRGLTQKMHKKLLKF